MAGGARPSAIDPQFALVRQDQHTRKQPAVIRRPEPTCRLFPWRVTEHRHHQGTDASRTPGAHPDLVEPPIELAGPCRVGPLATGGAWPRKTDPCGPEIGEPRSTHLGIG